MRLIRRSVTVLAFAAATTLLAGCLGGSLQPNGSTDPVPTPEIDLQLMTPASLTYQQYRSTPDFDSATYLVTDEIDLVPFTELLAANNLVEEDYESQTEAAPGSLTSTVTVTWPTGTTNVIDVTDSTDASEFEQELSDMVTEWNESDLGESITVP